MKKNRNTNEKGSGLKKLFNFKKIKKATRYKVEDDDILNPQKNGKKSKEKKAKDKKRGWKIFRICLFVFIALCIIAAGVVVGVITGIIDKTDSISVDDIVNQNLSTDIYDKDGNLIKTIYDSENRINVKYSDIPKNLVNAIVSIEDERFFSHNGVDLKRTLGAIVSFIFNGGESNFGGSTITQQLVKNIKKDKEASWERKIREWYRALSIETKMSKEEIFEAYASTIYLGEGSYGVEVASNTYFGKSIKDINLAESAVLAAIIQSPESTNPYTDDKSRQKLLDRQKLVLKQMLKLGKITQQEYDEAVAYEVVFKKGDTSLTDDVQSYFVDAVFEQVVSDFMEELGVERGLAIKMLYTGGYKIYTTFDPKVQKAIDDAYNNPKLFYKDKAGDFMQSSMVVMEQSTGKILGLIGGAGEKTGALSLNRATQTQRQPGSCMKPFGAYGPAFEQGVLSPGSGLDDCQFTQGSWTPKNYYNSFNGYVTARQAIMKSMNIPAVRANQLVDIDYAYNFAKNCGLTDLVSDDKNSASLALGGVTNGFTVLEMANAYATIANGGVHLDPIIYTKILDKNNKEILVKTTNAKQVMKDSTAYMLTSCLQSVVTGGTAAGSVKLGNMAVAGKTGNTNSDYDQWFCGFTPYYTIACWNGYDIGKPIGRDYPYTSIRLFNTVMNSISAGLTPKQFEQPSSIVTASVCKVSGLVATDACRADPRGDQTATDIFAAGTVPTKTCDIHKMAKICTVSGKLAGPYCTSTVDKSFITRNYTTEPKVKPLDWAYMLPTEVCDIHTTPTAIETPKGSTTSDPNDVEIY
jgi:penicillin-binding protein 1A